MHFLRSLLPVFLLATLGSGFLRSSPRVEKLPDLLIGYTELRTNLPGGRHANVTTMRAVVVKADGTGRRLLAEELTRKKPDTWTQFAGWSPDGKTADSRPRLGEPRERQVGGGAQGLPLHRRRLAVRHVPVDLASGKATNVTAVERVSFYNGGLFFWPGDTTKLGVHALIDGNSHPF